MVLRNLFAKAPEIREYGFERLFPGRDLDREGEERVQGDGKVNMEYVSTSRQY